MNNSKWGKMANKTKGIKILIYREISPTTYRKWNIYIHSKAPPSQEYPIDYYPESSVHTSNTVLFSMSTYVSVLFAALVELRTLVRVYPTLDSTTLTKHSKIHHIDAYFHKIHVTIVLLRMLSGPVNEFSQTSQKGQGFLLLEQGIALVCSIGELVL